MYTTLKDVKAYDYSTQRWVVGTKEAWLLLVEQLRQELHMSKSESYCRMAGVKDQLAYMVDLQDQLNQLLSL